MMQQSLYLLGASFCGSDRPNRLCATLMRMLDFDVQRGKFHHAERTAGLLRDGERPPVLPFSFGGSSPIWNARFGCGSRRNLVGDARGGRHIRATSNLCCFLLAGYSTGLPPPAFLSTAKERKHRAGVSRARLSVGCDRLHSHGNSPGWQHDSDTTNSCGDAEFEFDVEQGSYVLEPYED